MSKKSFVVGHRGASGLAPENTLPALEVGIAAGANLVEVDVQRTTDGVLIVFHDDNLERLTNGKGVMAQKSLAELQALDAGSHFSPEFAGTTLPTLDETLALVMSKGKHLVIEAKSPADFPGMETQLLDTIRQHSAEKNVTVISFDHAWLKNFKTLAPHIPVGPIDMYPTPALLTERWAEIIDVYWVSLVVRPLITRRLRKMGYEVWVWTVNHAWQMRLMQWLGVTGITSDYPNRWR